MTIKQLLEREYLGKTFTLFQYDDSKGLTDTKIPYEDFTWIPKSEYKEAVEKQVICRKVQHGINPDDYDDNWWYLIFDDGYFMPLNNE